MSFRYNHRLIAAVLLAACSKQTASHYDDARDHGKELRPRQWAPRLRKSSG